MSQTHRKIVILRDRRSNTHSELRFYDTKHPKHVAKWRFLASLPLCLSASLPVALPLPLPLPLLLLPLKLICTPPHDWFKNIKSEAVCGLWMLCFKFEGHQNQNLNPRTQFTKHSQQHIHNILHLGYTAGIIFEKKSITFCWLLGSSKKCGEIKQK